MTNSLSIPSLESHFSPEGKTKRILSLDGGGVRGILTLKYLHAIEKLLAPRHKHIKGFHLCDYFDLIAGTSTGAIIASCLAKRMPIHDILNRYELLSKTVFRFRLHRLGLIWPRFVTRPLETALKDALGPETPLGSSEIQTGLLIIAKRFDTTSPWPLTNNPRSKFYLRKPGEKWISNSHFPLWRVVRASTAAPYYFRPEPLEVDREIIDGQTITESGVFLDGGVSPYNNPALLAFLVATLRGYRFNWKSTPERLLLVSVGTGRSNPQRKPSKLNSKQAILSLKSIMDDCSALSEMILQGISNSPTSREIDMEIGNLDKDLISGNPLLSYLRYDVEYSHSWLYDKLKLDYTDNILKRLQQMERTDTIKEIKRIGATASRKYVKDYHFPNCFNI